MLSSGSLTQDQMALAQIGAYPRSPIVGTVEGQSFGLGKLGPTSPFCPGLGAGWAFCQLNPVSLLSYCLSGIVHLTEPLSSPHVEDEPCLCHPQARLPRVGLPMAQCWKNKTRCR